MPRDLCSRVYNGWACTKRVDLCFGGRNGRKRSLKYCLIKYLISFLFHLLKANEFSLYENPRAGQRISALFLRRFYTRELHRGYRVLS